MNEHDEIRDLLTLAASDALDVDEQRRVEAHLQNCQPCKSELEAWSRMTGALRELPTPATPPGMLERTHWRLANHVALRTASRWNHLFLGSLILLAWFLTFLSWPLLQWAGEKFVNLFDIPFTDFTLAWMIYMVVAWLGTGVAAAFLGQRYRQEGRTA